MGTNWSIGSSIWTRGRTSSLWGWRSTGTGCPGILWSLLLWRYSRPAWTRSCAACCRWPCFGRRVGLDDPQRSLPTPTILWFCDSVIFLLLFLLSRPQYRTLPKPSPLPEHPLLLSPHLICLPVGFHLLVQQVWPSSAAWLLLWLLPSLTTHETWGSKDLFQQR